MNSKRFLVHIKRQTNKVATFLRSRNVVTFFLFFLLASFMWYFYSAGTEREVNRNIPINYIGIPEDIALEKDLPQTIKFIIKDKGETLWSYNKSLFDTLHIDLTNQFKNNNLEIRFEEHFNKILSQLSPTTKIVELTPGYYKSSYTVLHSKVVPVVTSNVIKLESQHVMYDTVTIKPKFVTILGSANTIDTIPYLYLEPIKETFNKTKTVSVKIQKPKGVETRINTVNVTVPVEICTEKEIIVPVTIENKPAGMTIKTFPSEVKIKFSVGLSHFNKVTEKSFKAVLDYNDILQNPLRTTATLQIDYTSGYIFNIKPNISEVEFLIENI